MKLSNIVCRKILYLSAHFSANYDYKRCCAVRKFTIDPRGSDILGCTPFRLTRRSCKKVTAWSRNRTAYLSDDAKAADSAAVVNPRDSIDLSSREIAIYVWIPCVPSMSKLASQRPDWWGEDRLADVEVLWYARIGPRPIKRGHTRRGDILRGISFPASLNDVFIVIMIMFS